MNQFAYHFRTLRIDVSSGKSDVHPIASETLKENIGGCGLGVALILQTESPELDPFDHRSSIFFVFSPLVGSPLTTSAKFAVVSKSPLTHRINDSLAGSGFAIAGKKTGFDAIEITGRARQPTVVLIDDGEVKLESASDVWGKTIPDAESRLKEKFGSGYRIACIGPAGENKVLYATISHDGRHAGRGGSGAILGDKNIKAILVRGNKLVSWAQPDELNRLAKSLSKRSFGPATAKYRELGTAANLLVFNRLQCLPTRNFSDDKFEQAELLAPENLTGARDKVRGSCAACTIGCEHLYSIRRDNQSESGEKVRVEFESLFALGPMCGISDPDIVLRAAKLCDDLGLDTVSTGGTLAFAMECSERGLIDNQFQLSKGNTFLESISEIATRTGFGERLANGSRKMAEEIGSGAIDFAPQVKGLEMPGYDPRKLPGMALGLAVSSRGADHNKSTAYEMDFADDSQTGNLFSESRLSEAIFLENRSAVLDSLILCKFLRNVFEDFYSESARLLELSTGWPMTSEQLMQIGEKIVNSRKEFNIRAGWSPEEDRLPKMIFEKKTESGQVLFTEQELQQAMRSYNVKRGWSADGLFQ